MKAFFLEPKLIFVNLVYKDNKSCIKSS